MVDQRIADLRSELRKPENFEFHFTSNSDQIREAFLTAVAAFPFTYTGMVIDKTRLYVEGYNYAGFYKDLCGLVFEHAKPMLIDANVKIDKSGGYGFRRELFAHLKHKVNEPGEVCRIRQVTGKESHGNNLLQMADMICGAVARSYRLDKPKRYEFRRVIAHRERNVVRWPE